VGKLQRNIGLNHKLLESFELFLEVVILFVWETTSKEKSCGLLTFHNQKIKKTQRKKIIFVKNIFRGQFQMPKIVCS
jgi:hypothetical protein